MNRCRNRPPVLAALWLGTTLALPIAGRCAPDPPPASATDGEEKIEVHVVSDSGGEVRRWVLVDGEPVEDASVTTSSGSGGTAFSWVSVDDDGERRGAVEVRQMVRPRAFLGVSLLDLTEELREHLGGAADRGLLVSRVISDSPAADAGLRVGDLVVAVDGRPVRETSDLLRQIAEREAGDAIAVQALRGREAKTFSIVLTERQRLQVDVGPLLLSGVQPRLLAPRRLEIDPSKLSEAIDQWTERLDSPEYRQRYRLRQSRLEDRIRELEARLAELAAEIEALTAAQR